MPNFRKSIEAQQGNINAGWHAFPVPGIYLTAFEKKSKRPITLPLGSVKDTEKWANDLLGMVERWKATGLE